MVCVHDGQIPLAVIVRVMTVTLTGANRVILREVRDYAGIKT